MVEDEQVVYTDPNGKVWHPHRGYWCWKVSSELAQAQERIKELEAELTEAINDRNEAERLKIAWFECHLAHQSANQELGRANVELLKRAMDAERRASILSALEATPSAPKVTDEMIAAGLENYSEGGCMGLSEDERREVVISIITAAQEAGR